MPRQEAIKFIGPRWEGCTAPSLKGRGEARLDILSLCTEIYIFAHNMEKCQKTSHNAVKKEDEMKMIIS